MKARKTYVGQSKEGKRKWRKKYMKSTDCHKNQRRQGEKTRTGEKKTLKFYLARRDEECERKKKKRKSTKRYHELYLKRITKYGGKRWQHGKLKL